MQSPARPVESGWLADLLYVVFSTGMRSVNKQALGRAAHLIYAHPAIFVKRLGDEFLPLPRRRVRRWLNGVAIELDLSLTTSRFLRSMYFGIYGRHISTAMRTFLRPGDTFIDVGANIGYFSAIGMGLVGAQGEVHSFEPVPAYFEILRDMARRNPGFRTQLNQLAASDSESVSPIWVARHNIGWNTMVPGSMQENNLAYSAMVPTIRLDDYIQARLRGRKIALVKIDVEGFEFPVIRGLRDYFAGGNRPPIICEVAPAAYDKLGTSVQELAGFMEALGYKSFGLTPCSCRMFPPIDVRALTTITDVLWAERLPN